MKIFKTSDIRKIDEYTIRHEPIKSVDLMERASLAVFRWYVNRYDATFPVYVFCGNGNNGGDGLAVARLLAEGGYNVKVYVLQSPDCFSPDAQVNFERLKWLNKITIEFLYSGFPEISSNGVVIDALFGSGLNRPLEGYNASLVQFINQSGCAVVSIDIPSGLFGEDNLGNNKNAVIKANYTLSFEVPKLAFLLPENEKQVGEWQVLPIGLHPDALREFYTDTFYLTAKETSGLLRKRDKFSHKGTFGKAMLIAGSYGMLGAAVLAAKACYRGGIGWLKTHIPKCGVEVMQISVPESLISVDKNEHLFTSLPDDISQYNALGIGCGIGQHIETQNVFIKLIEHIDMPTVFDADALNILAKYPNKLRHLPPKSIITPHRKEFERLAGKWKNDYECLMLQKEFSVKNNLVVVLKGAHTSIATPDGKIYFNSTGNSGMATAGSGDVLTGVILALLAQQYLPETAACLGVYLHGLAADIAKINYGEEALMASDISDYLGNAFCQLHEI